MNTAAKSVALLLLAFLAATAHAQSALTLSPGSGHPTAVVTVSGSKFGDLEAVDVYVDTVDTILLVSSATGTFSGSVTIPGSAVPGRHYITAIGRHSGDAAQTSFSVTTPWVEQGFGAAHLGWNPYENVLSPANVSTLGLLWDVSTNSNGATPIVDAAHVIIANASGIQALSPTTGVSQWKALTTQAFYSSPALSNGVVFVGGTTSNFYALNQNTGATLWTTALGGSMISSPVVVGSVVYFGCEDDNVYALSTSTGKVLWTYATGAYIDSSPAVVNGVVYIGSTDDSLYALNAATGAFLWSYKTGGAVESTPAVSNGVVYVGSDDDNVYAIRAKGPETGALLWKYNTGGEVFTSPAVANGTVFVGSSNAVLYALNGSSGAVEWTYTTGGIVGNAAVANGVVYATARDGSAYAFDAANGEVLNFAEIGDTFFGSPVVSDGILYVSTFGGDTYAFSLNAGTNALAASAASARRLQGPPAPGSLHQDLTLPETR